MENPTIFTAAILIGIMTLSLQLISPELTSAADQQPKTKPHSKTVKPKTVKPKIDKPEIAKPKTVQPELVKPKIEPKFQTAETATEGNACFGVAPQIESLVPDEGQAGVKVTIKGAEFGSPDCLRGVSFGPGHASDFTMENESTILATVPTGDRKGLVMVTVTTASGEDSKAFLIK